METHAKSSGHNVFVLILMPEKIYTSAVTESALRWRILSTMRLSHRRPCTVTLCGLPLYGWVAVVAKWFHFSLIPLTVNSEMTRREDISTTGVLQQWHPITLQFNEFFKTTLFSHMFVKADKLGVWVYTPVAEDWKHLNSMNFFPIL